MNNEEYYQRLDKNTREALILAEECSAPELAHKHEGKWSSLEILEHIVLTEHLVLAFLMKRSDKIAETDEIFGFEKLDKLIVQFRARKVSAPEVLHPKGSITDVEGFRKVFLDQRELLKQSISSGKIVIDNRVHKHPFLGEMTIRDWLNFVPLHAQRHLDQIKDLLAEIRKTEL